MAAVVTDTTEADYILKECYEGMVVSQFNTSHKFLEMIEKDPTEWSGRRVVIALDIGRNPTARSFGENTSMPESDTTDGVDAYITASKIGGRFEITEDQIQASKNNRGAFVSVLEHQLKSLRETCRNTQHRQLFGNKISISGAYPTGIITQVNGGTSSATTAVLDDVRFIQKRKKYHIGTASEITGGTADIVKVTAINTSTKTVTFSAAVTLADNDIVAEGDNGATSAYGYGREMNGLAFAVSDSDDNFQGVDTDPAAFGPEWSSYVAGSGTLRNLSLELMNTVYDNVSDNSGSEPDLLCMHSSMLRQYELLLTPFTRFEAQKLEGGRKVITYANGAKVTPIEVDRYCTLGTIYFLNTQDFKMYERKPWGLLERSGSMLRQVADKENWEVALTWAGNLGLKKRVSQGRLDDLNYNLSGV